MGRLWYIYTNMIKSSIWGVKCETKTQTCSWDSCHQGCPGSSHFCTRWSSETCSQQERCHPLRPTAEHTHAHTLVWTVYTCQRLVKINVQSSVLVKRRFPGHDAVICGARMPWLVPSYLWLIPNGHYFPNIVNETHQLEPVCGGKHDFVMKPVHLSLSASSPHGYLCLGVLAGCLRPSGRRGRSWGSPHRDRTRPPAGLKPWWRPSSSSARACSHSTQHAAGNAGGEVGLINK